MNLLTVKEAAAYLRMPAPTIYYLVKEERIRAIRVGGRLRIDRDYLDEHVLKMGKRPQLNVQEAPQAPTVTRILIVDPQPQESAVPLHLAGKVQFDIAQSSLEAWSLLDAGAESYDVIILDADIADAPVGEFYVRVRARCPQAAFVITTDTLNREDLSEILRAGPVTFMTKPWQLEQLPSLQKHFHTPRGGQTRHEEAVA